MGNKIQAKDKKCIECKEQAVAFFPMVDPDIPSHPYCRKCLDKAKYSLMLKLQDLSDEGKIQGACDYGDRVPDETRTERRKRIKTKKKKAVTKKPTKL